MRWVYLIPKSLHPLLRRIDRLIGRGAVGEFWRSVWVNYGGRRSYRLDAKQVEWIVGKKIEGVMRNEDIARAQNVSVRWVQHLFSEYRKTGVMPSLKRPGRPKAPSITENERGIVLSFYREFRMCACYLEQVLYAHNIRINHKRSIVY